MNRLYSIVVTKALGLSSAVVVPIVMLIAVVTAVARVIVGIDRWKARNGFLTGSKSSNPHHSPEKIENRASSVAVRHVAPSS
jgi:hypothetical protein